mmetsp:Transcript_52107/g.86663  ORF Transcript_52107/g.86663 Transcript_52107/m.86663 type:complete len:84 (-) Transcript_52107:1510-1761(-)
MRVLGTVIEPLLHFRKDPVPDSAPQRKRKRGLKGPELRQIHPDHVRNYGREGDTGETQGQEGAAQYGYVASGHSTGATLGYVR